ncbi:MAG: NAD-dependent epimerase/dehydratase family protein [Acidimicrobiaceae bacterium]|jgi:UDP-glucose 4-epimerase|nr:NAD-dependent epimerase/dehydratase family protein [Acidimicrobiaceae bacterium]MBT5582275.1 NAD-dependent epimerase/dehydratase family protein [Acidimicrobiaceae bacterium]MBT5851684.1 NAD-dependent epimerase/dehydratase family protein [Acidimicrobiaceae bacterium]
MRIAIVGMGGDIGTGVALRFDKDRETSMLGIDMEPPRRRIRRAIFHRVDPADVEERTRLLVDFDPEFIIHAGIYEPHSRSNPHDAEIRTRAATRSVFRAARGCPSLRQIVMRSSTDVYGRSNVGANPQAVLGTDLQPHSRFGQMMADAEDVAVDFSKQRPDIGVTALRFAPIVGPYIPSPLGRYLRLPFVPTGPLFFEGKFQLVHIDDVHEAFVAAVRARAGGAFNIAGEGTVRGSEAARIGRRPFIPTWGPGWLVARAATAMFGAPLSEHSIESLTHGQAVSTEAAKRELSFVPAHSTRECIEDLYNWESVVRLEVDRSVA